MWPRSAKRRGEKSKIHDAIAKRSASDSKRWKITERAVKVPSPVSATFTVFVLSVGGIGCRG